MKIRILTFIVGSFILIQCARNESFIELQNDWIEVIETDTGYMTKSHVEYGMFLMRIIDQKKIQLMADDKVENLIIEELNYSDNTYKIKCLSEMEDTMRQTILIHRKTKESEIIEVTFLFDSENKDEIIMKCLFASAENAKTYPIFIW